METITTIGLDIAKSVFQVHGVDAQGKVIVRRQLKRRYVLAFFQKLPPCLVGIEACASSHYWSRELQALGHTVRLMPPAYVKPYVKRQKNDSTDAEAICEAVTRANMRFVPTKTTEQQSCLMLHRTRHLFIRQQTAVINAIRAHFAEFGIVAPGRDFSAWIGLVPKQHSSGGKNKLGGISKQGDRYLRSLFVAGALAVIRYAKIHGSKHRPWLAALLARKPTKVAAIALANKIARMAWAMMAKGERYRQPVALAAAW